MDRATLLAALDFARSRLLNSLDQIEKSGPDASAALAWRPGPGRAHIAWQAMHCAATHDKYLNVNVRGGTARDEALVSSYGGGSTPSDLNIPTFADIRATLEKHYTPFRDYVASASPDELARKIPNGKTVAEAILLLTWHEAHHQGQIHLTWNMYRAVGGRR